MDRDRAANIFDTGLLYTSFYAGSQPSEATSTATGRTEET